MKHVSLLLVLGCGLAAASGQRLGTTTQLVASVRSGFDPNEVVRQVQSAGSNPRTRIPANPILDNGEFLIDTSGLQAESIPSVAFDGSNFLVVWQDHRNADSTPDIYGARVTPQGAVLDSAGIVISQAANGQCSPALAFDGASYLVAWQDYRNGTCDIYGARVTPQGAVLDPSGLVISQAAHDQRTPALAFDGADFLVVWQDGRGGSDWDVYGARATPQGTVLDSAGIPISTAAGEQWTPALVFDGANFLVVWQEAHIGSICDIYGARVTPQGAVLDSAGIVISQEAYNQCYPAVGFDGTNSFAVWQDYRSGSDLDIYGARVTPQGTVLDTAGIVISQASDHQWSPAVAFDGGNFLVEWIDNRRGSEWDIYGARVTPEGSVFGGGSVVRREGGQTYPWPKLCCGDNSQMLLVYQGWADTVGGRTYNTERIWGKIDPNPAIAETPGTEVRTTNSKSTIVRGVLFLSEASSHKPQAASLMDATGRRVMDLVPGANDVRALAPGVYFVRKQGTRGQGFEDSRVTKVVVTR